LEVICIVGWLSKYRRVGWVWGIWRYIVRYSHVVDTRVLCYISKEFLETIGYLFKCHDIEE